MLDDFNKKAGKALSWMFNNNGNQIDHTRLRPLDGSSAYSTGLRRLIPNKWEYALTATGVYAATQSLTKTTFALGVHIIVPRINHHFGWKTEESKDACLRIQKSNKCILTTPDENTPPTSPDDMLSCTTVSGVHLCNLLIAGVAAVVPTYASSQSFAVHATLAGIMVSEAKGFIRHFGVVREKYVVEDTPPPQKKTVKERKENPLGALLPQPVPVPITASGP